MRERVLFSSGVLLYLCISLGNTGKDFTENEIRQYRKRVLDMFHHAYDGYMKYAYPYDELRPLSCNGQDTWGSFSLTLIDALDTLAVMGNYTEFRRVAALVIDKMNFDIDINASVFETNIRIIGGLLSAHLLTKRAEMELEPGWPCTGPLLRLAEDVGRRILPAFDTATGMPYGTVNLRHGVPDGETTITCTAGVGTFIVEFGTLSRLTGDPIFEKVAIRALRALWDSRSEIGMVGNHIDVSTGKWTALDSGIGGGIDSYFEYLVKGAAMFDIPELLEMFHEYNEVVDNYIKRDDWYLWAHMKKGGITLPMFTSLDAYWPGIQSMIGDIDKAMKTMHNFHQVWKQFGFTPEYYNIVKNEAHTGREGYPLRPELIESAMYLYRATKDPFLLELGVDILESIEYSTKTKCGYATVKDVNTHRLEDRMESFFLAETTKYLYLLFDEDNFIHNNGSSGTVIQTPNGECVIDSGGYFFNTEAHPIDAASVYCCSSQKKEDDRILQEMHDNMDLLAMLGIVETKNKVIGKKLSVLKKEKSMEILLNSITAAELELKNETEMNKTKADTQLEGDLENKESDINSNSRLDSKEESEHIETDEIYLDEEDLAENSKIGKSEKESTTVDKLSESELDNQEKDKQRTTAANSIDPTESTDTGEKSASVSNTETEENLDQPNVLDIHLEDIDSSEKSKTEGEDKIPTVLTPDSVDAPNSQIKTIHFSKQKLKETLSDNKMVDNISGTGTAKGQNLSNLEKVLNLLLGASNKNKHPAKESPNVNHLYTWMQFYPLNYKSNPELMSCKAQAFHMRMSVQGEMFNDDIVL